MDIPVAPAEYVTPLPVVEFTAPAPSVTHVTPSEQFSPFPQETAEVVQVMPHERLLQRTDVLAIEHNTSAPSVTHVTPSEQFSPLPQETVEVVQIGFGHPPCVSDGIGDLIAVDVPVPEMSVDEVEPGTPLPRERVRQRNAQPPEILEEKQCSDDPIVGFSLSTVPEQFVEVPSLQEGFRECTVTRSVAANVDYDAEPTSTAETNKDKTNLLSDGNIITANLSDGEFAQALVPLNSAISQYLGHLKSMSDRVSSFERTLEETRFKLDSGFSTSVQNIKSDNWRTTLPPFPTRYSASPTRLWKSKVSCLQSFVSDTTGRYNVLNTASEDACQSDIYMSLNDCPSVKRYRGTNIDIHMSTW